MAWTIAKTAIAVGVGILLAGVTTVAVNQISKHREQSVWQAVSQMVRTGNVSKFKDAPATVAIRKTEFYPQVDDNYWEGFGGKILGMAIPTAGVFGHAYDVNRTRFVHSELLPAGRYDFVVTLHTNQHEALQAAATARFGIVGRKVTRGTDVLLLRITETNAPGLKLASETGQPRSLHTANGYLVKGVSLSMLCYMVERMIEVPVIAATDDPTSRYDIDIAWNRRQDPGPEEVKRILRDQLGIELTPTNMPIELLELSKAK